MQVIARKAAKAKGLRRYFTGKPCLRGHIDWRQVGDGSCSACARERSIGDYYKDIETHRKKGREQAAKHRDKRIKYQREWYENNKEYFSQWAKDNSEKVRETGARYRENNRSKRRASFAEWAKKNNDKVRANCRNRNAKRKSNGGKHSAEDIGQILKMQRGKCAYCRISLKGKYHVDHIIALANRGGNDRKNLQVLCPPCNHEKHTKDPMVFARQKFGMLL